jgi:uncharacterized damage-inducible protein DinB
MNLIKASVQHTLSQLRGCVQQLDSIAFSESIPLLSNNSIGKHCRHVIELYQCLLVHSRNSDTINYDDRAHSKSIETNIDLAIKAINEILSEVDAIETERTLTLVSSSDSNGNLFESRTSLSRELQYNIEHTIHHMAIMQIAIQTYYPTIALPKDFGIAYSTVQYQKMN